jgi:cytochrome c556
MRRLALLGAVLSVLGVTQLHAQSPSGALTPDQTIAIRQALMDLQQGSAAALKAAVENKADVKPLSATVKGLVSSSKIIPALFPVGTEKGHDTKALAAVWSNPADFAKDANNLTEAAEKLAALADANDTAGFATQFVAVGRACGGCHREFKAKD